MKKYKIRDFFKEIIIFTCFLFSVEVLFRVVDGFSILDYATLRIFLSSFCIATFFECLFSFVKSRRIREILLGFVLFLSSCYAIAQVGFHNFLGMYVSVGTSSQMSAVSNYVINFFASFKIEYYVLLLPYVFYLFFIFLKQKGFEKARFSFVSRFLGLITLFVSGFLFYVTLYVSFMQNPLQLVSNERLFVVPSNSSIVVNQFGTTMYAILDIKQTFWPAFIEEEIEEETEDEKETERVFDDTAWIKIIKEEQDSTMNTLNRYFRNRSITQPNEYTGFFEGKNLIVIMMESVNTVLENKKYFPNFNRMLQNGWYWENNYSPRNACATGDNEFSGMTSMYPLNTSCTVNVKKENTYFTSIFNHFNQMGYTTSSFHDLDSTYYARDIFHYNMGVSDYYDANRLGMDIDPSNYTEWPSDKEFMELSSEIFMNDDPFMVWMTTVTAHQPYDESSFYGDFYYDLFSNTNYSDNVKRYLSKTKVTDDALGVLLDNLEEHNLLEDTVIVLYGDHYPYGLSNEDVQSLFSYDVLDFYEIERTPFLIYNSELEKKVFQEKTFYMNIVPTLLNLFNADYDPRFYLGEDLFSSNYSSRVVFADGSWEDDIARYNAIDGSIVYFDEDKTYTVNEIQKINRDIDRKKEMSKLAISKNYFQYLEEKLEKNKNKN